MKSELKVQITQTLDDGSKNIHRKKADISSFDRDDMLSGLAEYMLDFACSVGYSSKDVHERFSETGRRMVEAEIENEDEDEHEAIASMSGDSHSMREVSDKIITDITKDSEAFGDFMRQFSEGDDNFKKGVFRSFLKDLYNGG